MIRMFTSVNNFMLNMRFELYGGVRENEDFFLMSISIFEELRMSSTHL